MYSKEVILFVFFMANTPFIVCLVELSAVIYESYIFENNIDCVPKIHSKEAKQKTTNKSRTAFLKQPASRYPHVTQSLNDNAIRTHVDAILFLTCNKKCALTSTV